MRWWREWRERRRQERERRGDDGLDEFAVVPGESPEDRARRLLVSLLPHYRTRDEAMSSLYYIYPWSSQAVRLKSIAAALWILRDEQRRREAVNYVLPSWRLVKDGAEQTMRALARGERGPLTSEEAHHIADVIEDAD